MIVIFILIAVWACLAAFSLWLAEFRKSDAAEMVLIFCIMILIGLTIFAALK